MDAFLHQHLDGGEEAHRKRCALGVRWKCRELTERLEREAATYEHLNACTVLREALGTYSVVGVDLPDPDLLAEDVRRTEMRMARKRVSEQESTTKKAKRKK